MNTTHPMPVRLYLLQLALLENGMPIPGYLIQLSDGTNILVDTSPPQDGTYQAPDPPSLM